MPSHLAERPAPYSVAPAVLGLRGLGELWLLRGLNPPSAAPPGALTTPAQKRRRSGEVERVLVSVRVHESERS